MVDPSVCISDERFSFCVSAAVRGPHFCSTVYTLCAMSAERCALCARAGMRSRCGHFRWTVRTFDLISDQRFTLSACNRHVRSNFRKTVQTFACPVRCPHRRGRKSRPRPPPHSLAVCGVKSKRAVGSRSRMGLISRSLAPERHDHPRRRGE